jgi:hypothetical protein
VFPTETILNHEMTRIKFLVDMNLPRTLAVLLNQILKPKITRVRVLPIKRVN